MSGVVDPVAAAKADPVEESKPVAKPKRVVKATPDLVVVACAVLRTREGGEQYLYGGAVVDPRRFTAESVAHARDVGQVVERI